MGRRAPLTAPVPAITTPATPVDSCSGSLGAGTISSAIDPLFTGSAGQVADGFDDAMLFDSGTDGVGVARMFQEFDNNAFGITAVSADTTWLPYNMASCRTVVNNSSSSCCIYHTDSLSIASYPNDFPDLQTQYRHRSQARYRRRDSTPEPHLSARTVCA